MAQQEDGQESLNDALRARILADVNLDEESLKEGVNQLRTWLTTEPYLPQTLDYEILQAFLVSCKTIERAKAKLTAAFTKRCEYPQFLASRNPFIDISKEKCLRVAYLPGVTHEGQKVMFACLPDLVVTPDFDFVTSLRFVFMQVELSLKQEPVTRGHIYVVDASNLGFSILKKLPLRETKASANCFFELFPVRFSGYIFFNAPPLTQIGYQTFLKPFLPKKIKERVSICQDDSQLQLQVPAYMLPEEYGGNAPPLDAIISNARRNLEENAEWLCSFGARQAREDDIAETEHRRTCEIM